MKRTRLQEITVLVYFALFIGFALLILYMGFFERNEVYSSRSFHSSYTIQPDAERIISDPAAPAGIRREFTLTIPVSDSNEDCLVFYLVHAYAEVWFDDELVYRLTPDAGNRIGDSPSSNWVILPIYPSDRGRVVTVVLTPAYESVVGRTIEFEFGSRYDMIMRQLKADMPQLIMSVLCILVGLMLIFAQLFLSHHKKSSDWNLFYLGLFTLLIGIWRITDTRSSPILLPQNPMLLGYITIGALFLIAAPLPLYFRMHYPNSEKPLLIAALLGCICALFALVCQVFNLADFREVLVLCHITLIAVAALLLWVCLSQARLGADHSKFWKFILLLAVGFTLDMTRFYINGSSADILFTILALLVFSVSRFISSMQSANRKAYTDLKTGLFNKNRWEELMCMPRNESDTIGIIMLDLNHLKYINDTMGHEAGDRLIRSFANILRNTIPATNTICRWGGDEFTVLITNASQEKMEQYVAAIADAATQYNDSDGSPKIHYAAGWVLSSEFPERTTDELLAEADKRMYEDKRQWYSFNANGI